MYRSIRTCLNVRSGGPEKPVLKRKQSSLSHTCLLHSSQKYSILIATEYQSSLARLYNFQRPPTNLHGDLLNRTKFRRFSEHLGSKNPWKFSLIFSVDYFSADIRRNYYT